MTPVLPSGTAIVKIDTANFVDANGKVLSSHNVTLFDDSSDPEQALEQIQDRLLLNTKPKHPSWDRAEEEIKQTGRVIGQLPSIWKC